MAQGPINPTEHTSCVKDDTANGKEQNCSPDNIEQHNLYTNGTLKWHPPPKDWVIVNVHG
jgi:alpha-glucuronidase